MLGVPVDALLSKSEKSLGEGWDEAERTALQANMAARRPFLDLVYSRINAEGARQIFHVSGEPMFDASGRFAGYRGVGREVAEAVHDKANC